jgi:CheY-like chemotaxis protein
MTATRVLVVDDDAEVCLLVARRLSLGGYEVLTAQTRDAALALFDAGRVDCLVVDKTLPGMHGAELIAALRQRSERLAVVLLSEHPEPFSFENERPAVILLKPFKSLAAIDEAVEQALAAFDSPSAVETFKERLTQVVAEIAPLRRKRE